MDFEWLQEMEKLTNPIARNVVIYFDKDTQRVLFERYADILAPDAHLFIGHSETLYKVSTRFDSLGHTIYRKNQ